MKTQDNDPNTKLINASIFRGKVEGYVLGFLIGLIVTGIICVYFHPEQAKAQIESLFR